MRITISHHHAPNNETAPLYSYSIENNLEKCIDVHGDRCSDRAGVVVGVQVRIRPHRPLVASSHQPYRARDGYASSEPAEG